MQTNKWVYRFDERDDVTSHVREDQDSARNRLAGKGANLADMARIGVPVPPGFTVTTEACDAYLDSGCAFPENVWDQVLSGIKTVESETGMRFGDEKEPLMVSCRSGAKISVPGMMDSVPYIGLNDYTVPAMVRMAEDPRLVYDAYLRLIQTFGSVVGIGKEAFDEVREDVLRSASVHGSSGLSTKDWGRVAASYKEIYRCYSGHVFPEDPYEQLEAVIGAFIEGWKEERSANNGDAPGTIHGIGTAVTVSAMLFGNMGEDCSTGVATTRNGSSYGTSLNCLRHARAAHLLRHQRHHNAYLAGSGGPMQVFLVSSEGSPKSGDASSVDPKLLAKLLIEIIDVNKKKDVTMKVTHDTFEAEIKSPPLSSHISSFVSRLLRKIPGIGQ